ncbi:hypothetical protein V8G54_003812 [Vigna mungo]|uniref:UDP-glycosyltransferases domain-containing protein n=1 Tax=Vigna mungo TaxID=3915 RepID=A0AAQ3PEP1_VIGMU
MGADCVEDTLETALNGDGNAATYLVAPGANDEVVDGMGVEVERMNGNYLEQVLREGFSHPSVNGIMLWTAYHPNGCYQMCLTNKNFKNLPAGDVKTGRVEGVTNVHGSYSLKWLDAQPHGSVTLVCFGSGGTLSRDQIEELALGLEMSEQRFVWVVKSLNKEVANASYFTEDTGGFVERTKGRGLVVASWIPQAQVLSHPSIGGFVTHCGWNSILESVVNGVPLVAWPLYTEQNMNVVLVSEGMKVAVRVVIGENGLAERGEIARVVKMVMEGEEGKKLLH